MIVKLILLIEIPVSALLIYFIRDYTKTQDQKIFLQRLIVVSAVEMVLILILVLQLFKPAA
jgi:NADH:ubiquinone oxidoreductase subunit K